jgi:hypothetical protein
MQSVAILSVIMMNVVMLKVVTQNVVAPFWKADWDIIIDTYNEIWFKRISEDNNDYLIF